MSPLEDSPPSGHQDKWKGWIPLAGIHYKPDVVLTLHTKMKRINFGWTVFFYVSWDIYYEKAFWLLSSYHFLIHSLGLFQINLCPKTHMRWYTLCRGSAMFCYNTSRCYLFFIFYFYLTLHSSLWIEANCNDIQWGVVHCVKMQEVCIFTQFLPTQVNAVVQLKWQINCKLYPHFLLHDITCSYEWFHCTMIKESC